MKKTINDPKGSGKLLFLLLLVSVPWTFADDPSTTNPTTIVTTASTEAPTTTAAPTTTEAPTPPPPVKYTEYDFEKPMHELRGSYVLQYKTHDQERPGWASIWPVNEAERSFSVYFWPPKYCHAIYLCAVKSKTYDSLNRFDEFDCDKSFVKFYPHIRKIHFKANEQATEVQKFYVDGSLEFQQSAPGKYLIRVFNEEPVDEEGWKKTLKEEPTKYTDLEWDLDQKDLFILTNSRMCEVNKPGMGDFAPVFTAHPDNSEKYSSKWPSWLPNNLDDQKSKIPTLTLASTAKSKKTVDLLAYLKELKTETKLAKISQRCANYEKVGAFGARKPVYEHSPYVSTATYHVFQMNTGLGGGFVRKLTFEMSNCQWIRFWASESPIQDYAKEMKPEDTLDFFLEEGFYMPPDSNEPVPLPDVQLMNKIQFTVLKEADGDDQELIEIAFGYANEKFLYHQFFRSKKFGKADFKLHMIRSPRCESNFVIDGGYRDSAAVQLTNLKDVKECEFNYLTEASQQPPPPPPKKK